MKKLIVLLLFIGLSCESYEEHAPFKKYTIKEGQHSSVTARSSLETPWLSYDVIFDESAIYETQDPSNQADINKLFGFSECNSNHIDNSIRFGWNWFNNQLNIYAFQHQNGDISWVEMGNVELNKIYRYNIFLFEDYYELEIEGLTAERLRLRRPTFSCEIGFYYRLFPYFGGNETAPQDIHIYMKRVFEELNYD